MSTALCSVLIVSLNQLTRTEPSRQKTRGIVGWISKYLYPPTESYSEPPRGRWAETGRGHEAGVPQGSSTNKTTLSE